VANPKTGTTSVGKLLKESYGGIEPLLTDDPETILDKHVGMNHVVTAFQEDYDISNFYSFSFVRNPWDRLVSWYGMTKRNYPDYDHNFKEYVRTHAGLQTSTIYPRVERDAPGCKANIFTQRKWVEYVDFVGRYETLYKDLDKVFAHLGLPQIDRDAIPAENISKHREYREGYYTDYIKDLVADMSSWEIDKFGYEF
jgi:hypothetical protein